MLKKSLVYATLTFAFCTFFDSHMVNGMDVEEEGVLGDGDSSTSVSNTTDTSPGDASSFSSDLNKPDWDGLKGKLSKKIKKFSKLPDSGNDKAIKAFKKQIGGDTNFFLYVLKTYKPRVNEEIVSSLYQLFSGDKKSRKNFLSALTKSFKYTNAKWVQPNISINGRNIKLFDLEELAKVKEKQLSKFLAKQFKGMLKKLKTSYIKALKINQLDNLVSTLNSLEDESLSGIISGLETFATKDSGSKVVVKSALVSGVPVSKSTGIAVPKTAGTSVEKTPVAAPTPKKYAPRSPVQTPKVDLTAPVISGAQPTVVSVTTTRVTDPILGLPMNKRNQALIAQALSGVDQASAVRIYQLLKNWNIIIPQGTEGVNPKYTMTSYDQAYLVGELTRLAGTLDESTLEKYLNTLISRSPKEVYIFNNRQRIIERFTATLVRKFEEFSVSGAAVDSGLGPIGEPYTTEVRRTPGAYSSSMPVVTAY